MTRKSVFSAALVAGLVAILSLAQAQDAAQQPAQRPGGPGQDQGGRRFDPAQMRERMMGGIKEQTGANDEEWRAMQPKIEKIMTIQRDLRPGFGMMGGGRFRDGAEGAQQSKVSEAQRALRSALEDKNTPAEELTRKVGAYREARDRAREELKEAQKGLKGSVSPRAEAALVLNGILD
jgi:hypothetical protein